MDIKEIQDLIKLMGKNGVGKLEIKNNDFEIELTTVEYAQAKNATVTMAHATAAPPLYAPSPMYQQPTQDITPVAAATLTEPKAETSSSNVIVKSPMVGTFYRSSGPEKPVLVSVGDEIVKGQPICIIEAMKLFNEIESEISGKIIKILIDDASPVEFDQPLFLVEPN